MLYQNHTINKDIAYIKILTKSNDINVLKYSLNYLSNEIYSIYFIN